MKYKILSKIYKNQSIKFDDFLLKFNEKGEASIEIKEGEKEEFENILKLYPNIYDEKNPPLEEETTIKKENQKNNDSFSIINEKNKEIESLKSGNFNLAKQIKDLKIENEKLKNELKQFTEVKEENIEKELNSKNLNELKAILEDVYADYKDEWKSLTKKDDIITYIISKS